MVIPAGIVLGCGIGGAGFYYLEAPGWAVVWLALFAALGWLGYTATPVFDEPNPVQASTQPTRLRPMRDGSLLIVDLPGGRFLMGSPDSDDMASNDEKSQHEVTVSPFRIAITPVTAELYRRIMSESSPSGREADVRWPAKNVSWFDAIEFCNRLYLDRAPDPQRPALSRRPVGNPVGTRGRGWISGRLSRCAGRRCRFSTLQRDFTVRLYRRCWNPVEESPKCAAFARSFP